MFSTQQPRQPQYQHQHQHGNASHNSTPSTAWCDSLADVGALDVWVGNDDGFAPGILACSTLPMTPSVWIDGWLASQRPAHP